MDKTYLVWNNVESAFVESIKIGRVYYTTDIDSAYQYKSEDDAECIRQLLPDSVTLEWR